MQLAGEEQHAEQAVDDGRNARKRFRRHANQIHDSAALFCVFHQIDGASDAEGNCRQQRKDRHRAGIQNRRQHGLVLRRIGQ